MIGEHFIVTTYSVVGFQLVAESILISNSEGARFAPILLLPSKLRCILREHDLLQIVLLPSKLRCILRELKLFQHFFLLNLMALPPS